MVTRSDSKGVSVLRWGAVAVVLWSLLPYGAEEFIGRGIGGLP